MTKSSHEIAMQEVKDNFVGTFKFSFYIIGFLGYVNCLAFIASKFAETIGLFSIPLILIIFIFQLASLEYYLKIKQLEEKQ